MANSLLDRVPNLPRAEDLDMRNFSRNFVGPQPLPEAMRPNMRDSVGAQPQPQAQPQARPQYQNAAPAREVPRNASNPAAAAAYREMDRNAARPMPTQAAPTPTARDMMRNAGNSVAQGAKNYANQASSKAAADAATKAAVRGAQAQAAANGGMIAKAKNLVGTAGGAAKSGLGKASLVAGAGVGAYNTANSLREGDYGDAALSAADTAAIFGLTNPVTALPSGLWLGGRAGTSGINAALDTDAGRPIADAIGGSINQLGLSTGLWGTDDSAYLTQRAESEIGAGTAAAPKKEQPQAEQSRAEQTQAPVRDLDYEQQLQALGQSFEARPGMPRPDLGYGVHDRTTMTNEQVGNMNPQGRVTVTRGPNGTMEFSGNDVRGAVSYQDDQGKALAGGGLRGQGFSDFRVAPADSNVAMGPNGSYAYSNSPNLRDFSPGGNGVTGRTEYADGQVPQIIQDARRSQAESSARAQQLGVNISGMAPWQANQYMDEVQQARNINASQQANVGSYEERLKQLNDPTSDISKAMRRITSDMPDEFRNKRKYMAQHMQQQNEAALRLAGDYLGETDRIRKDGTSRYGIDEVSRTAEMKDATDRRNADLRMAFDLAGRQADAQKARSDDAIRQNDLDIKNADRTRQRFAIYDRDDPSKVDEAATSRAVAAMDSVMPGFSRMGEDARGKAYPYADALMGIYNRASQGRELGLGQTVFGNTNAPLNSMPDFKGGKLKRQGLSGAFPGQAGVGGYYVEMDDGREVYLGQQLSQNELALIEKNIATGKWKD